MLTKFIKLIDFIGNDISLLHKGSKRVKTVLGGLMTIIISVFSVYSIVYFGKDLFARESPNSRFSKAYQNSSRIMTEDRPLVFNIINGRGANIPSADKYLTFTAKRYENLPDGNVTISNIFVERCDPDKHIPKFKDLYIKSGIDLSTSYCSNSKKVQFSNGTIGEQDIYFENEYGAYPSVFTIYYFDSCKNTTANGNWCAPQEEINAVEENMYFKAALVEEYIDLSDYKDPSKTYLQTYTTNISPKVYKNTHVVYKNTYITTDSGIIMEDPSTVNRAQLDSIRTDLGQNVNGYYKLYFESTRITDNYFRKYVKVQDLVASIGGLVKFIFIFSALLLHYYSKDVLNFDIAEALYTEQEGRTIMSGGVLPGSTAFDLKDISVNNLVGPTYTVKDFRPSVKDCIKAIFKCKSRYTKKHYEQLRDLIKEKFELTYLFKKLQDFENLANLVLDSQQKLMYMKKRPLRIDTGKILQEEITIDRPSNFNLPGIRT
jgi:hypothetical protein